MMMRNILVVEVDVQLACNINDAVRDACELAEKLGLSLVKFKANGETFRCYHTWQVVKTSDGRTGHWIGKAWQGANTMGDPIEWEYHPAT